VGKEICGLSRGWSALLQAGSLGAPFVCDCPWHWSEKKHYRAEGRKNTTKRMSGKAGV